MNEDGSWSAHCFNSRCSHLSNADYLIELGKFLEGGVRFDRPSREFKKRYKAEKKARKEYSEFKQSVVESWSSVGRRFVICRLLILRMSICGVVRWIGSILVVMFCGFLGLMMCGSVRMMLLGSLLFGFTRLDGLLGRKAFIREELTRSGERTGKRSRIILGRLSDEDGFPLVVRTSGVDKPFPNFLVVCEGPMDAYLVRQKLAFDAVAVVGTGFRRIVPGVSRMPHVSRVLWMPDGEQAAIKAAKIAVSDLLEANKAIQQSVWARMGFDPAESLENYESGTAESGLELRGILKGLGFQEK